MSQTQNSVKRFLRLSQFGVCVVSCRILSHSRGKERKGKENTPYGVQGSLRWTFSFFLSAL